MTAPQYPSTPPDSHRPVDASETLRVFFAICRAWNLNAVQSQTLLGADEDTYLQWSGGEVKPQLTMQTLDRISYVVRIFAAIRRLIQPVTAANDWVHAANAASPFLGGSALETMLSSDTEKLRQVCLYLESQMSGDFS